MAQGTDHSPRPVRVACVQVASPPEERRVDRVDRVSTLVERAGRDHDVVVLPELWPSGYFSFLSYEADAEPLDGPTVARLRRLASDLAVVLVAGSLVERGPDGLTNTTVTIGPSGDVLHVYRKIHLFGYESEEARLLVPGTEAEVADTPLGRLATSTCYDLRFPELYRLLVDQRVEIVVVPAAWPAARLAHWRLLVQARAVENLMVVIACNAVGTQGDIELAGHSMIVGPWGDVIAEGGDQEGVVSAEVDVSQVAAVRARFPALDHRRLPFS